MSGMLGSAGTKCGQIGTVGGLVTTLWSGHQTSTGNITMSQSMHNFTFITFIFGGNFTVMTMPSAFFVGNQGGYVHGHMLDSYDNEHCYVRYVNSTTIDFNDGTSGTGIRWVLGIR